MSDLDPAILHGTQRIQAALTEHQALSVAQGTVLTALDSRVSDARMEKLDKLSAHYTPALAAQLATLQSGYQLHLYLQSGHFSTGGKVKELIIIVIGGGQGGSGWSGASILAGGMGGVSSVGDIRSDAGVPGQAGGPGSAGVGLFGLGSGGTGQGLTSGYTPWAPGGAAGHYLCVTRTVALDTPVIVGAGGTPVNSGSKAGQAGGVIILSREVA